MIAILAVGLLVGLQHAMEADHLAAVAGLACGTRSRRSIIGHGLVWGFGHFLALSAFAGTVVLMESTINDTYANVLEFAVGAILIVIGGRVLLRLRRQRVHFHTHMHSDGQIHFHAHSHGDDVAVHEHSQHNHTHPWHFPVSSLLVGTTHGVAGSAVLVSLSAGAFGTISGALFYILAFGLASMLGMAALSFVIAVPFSLSGKLMTRFNTVLQMCVGLISIFLGGSIIYETGSMLASLV